MKKHIETQSRFWTLCAIFVFIFATEAAVGRYAAARTEPAREAPVKATQAELVELHRLYDPSLFKCALCRLSPASKSGSFTMIRNQPAANCTDAPAGQSRL
jgi:hypothetical protein